jgi:Mg2+-importing ATPase
MPLSVTTVAVVGAGVALPFTPAARALGFAPLPLTFFLFLVVVVVTYLAIVEVVKERVMHRLLATSHARPRSALI